MKTLDYQIAQGNLKAAGVRHRELGKFGNGMHLYRLSEARRLPMRCNAARNQRPLDPDCMTAEEIARRLKVTPEQVRSWCLHSLGEYIGPDGKTCYWHSFQDAREYHLAMRMGPRPRLSWQRRRSRREVADDEWS